MKKIIAFLLMVLVIALCVPVEALAHGEDEHNKDLEAVLFGDENYKRTQKGKTKDKITAIEYASYLAIDQFNGNGQKKLDFLNDDMKISGLPDSIDAINYSASSEGDGGHRSYTHRGWDFSYTKNTLETGHWDIRKEILLKTVNKQFKFGFLSGKFSSYNKKCDSLCALIYYVHILGDHDEDKKYKGAFDKIEIAGRSDKYDIVHELEKHLAILFDDQKDTYTYKSLIQELNTINGNAETLMNKTGGINTPERFDEYHSYGDDVLETLKIYVPKLLKKDSFFAEAFDL